ncbi:MAG: hypothetical protein WBF37_10640, partial [Dehalococcoidia bacterium]
ESFLKSNSFTEEDAMNHKRLLPQMTGLTLVLVFLVACGTPEPPAPEFYSIGVSANEIVPVYEGLGFSFTDSELIYDHSQAVGVSRDGVCFIQLIGADDLVSVRIAARLSKDMGKDELHQIRGYMDTMIDLVLPDWSEGHDWFENNTLDIGDNGSRSTTEGDVEVTVVIKSSNMTFGLTFGDWSTLPAYDSGDQEWETE